MGAIADKVRIKNAGNVVINPATEETLAGLAGIGIPAHDYISLTYTGTNLTGVVYKSGGASGTVVATLTLAYTGSVLTSVTKT